MLSLVTLILLICAVNAFIKPVYREHAVFSRSQISSQPESQPEKRMTQEFGFEGPGKEKKLADKIQDAGGLRTWLVDQLMKDRTEDGDGSKEDLGLEKPLVLSPAAKERLRKMRS